MPVTICSCGLDMQVRKAALVCDHCDGTEPHVASACTHCRAIGLGRTPRS